MESNCNDWRCTCDGFVEHFARDVFGWSARRHSGHRNVSTVASHSIHPPWWLSSACIRSDGPELTQAQCDAWNCTCAGFSAYFGAGGAGGMGWATANPHLLAWWTAKQCTTTPPATVPFEWGLPLTPLERALIAGAHHAAAPRGGASSMQIAAGANTAEVASGRIACGGVQRFVHMMDAGGVASLHENNGVLADAGFSNTLVAFSNALLCTAKRSAAFGLALGPNSHANLDAAFDISNSTLRENYCIMSEVAVRARKDGSSLGKEALLPGDDDVGAQGWFLAGGCRAVSFPAQQTSEHLRAVLKALFTNPRPAIRRAVDRFIGEKLLDARGEANYIGVHFRAFLSIAECTEYTQHEIDADTQSAGVFDGLSPASLYQLCTMPPKYVATLALEAGIDARTAPKFLATDRHRSDPAANLHTAGYVRYDEKEFSGTSLEGLVIDMLILARSRFFVGNPASSMAANIVTLRRTFHQVGPRFSNFAMPIELGGHHPYRNIFNGNRRRRLVQSDRRLVSPCPSWHVSEGEHFASKTKAIGRFGGEVTLEAAKSTCCANPKCAAFMYGRNGTGGVYMAGPLYPTLTRGHDRQSGWELRRRKGHDGYTKPAFVPKKTLQFGRYAKAHAWWTDRGCSEEAADGQHLWDREADAKGGVLTLLAPDAQAFQCWIQAELGAVKTEWSSLTVDAASVADAQAVNTAHASQQASARKEEEEAELRGVAVEALAPVSKEVERAAAPPPRSLIRGAEAWSAMRHRAITCEASNIVPTRGDDFAINIQDHRPWSAQATSFPLRPPAEDTSAQRECAIGSELVNAYKLGRRRWTSRKGKTLVEAYDAQCGVASDMGRSRRTQLAACWALLRDGPVEPLGAKNASMYTQKVAYMEKYLAMQGMASAKQEARWSALGCDAMLAPCFALEDQLNSELSTFETSGCAVPFISGAALCELLGKFRSIDFIGDSLTRHLIQGLDILTSEDLVMGSSQMSFGDKQCVCDGAFSEAAVCREQTDVLNHKTQTAAYLWKPKGCPTAPVRYVTAPVLITAGISNDEALSLGILVTRTRPRAHARECTLTKHPGRPSCCCPPCLLHCAPVLDSGTRGFRRRFPASSTRRLG